ncbi:MAG TPA: HAD family phosphatase [Ignavibacteriaceae bacterium]|nr:HAD family phosphatase [Ignavibacteriaceae bacterium]
MSENISVIAFDLGNVLIPFDYTIMVNKLDRIEVDLGAKFIGFYKSNYNLHREFERGDLSNDAFIEIMLNALENKVDGLTFCKYYSEIFTINDEVIALLPKLKKNYQLVLLSNTNGIHKKYGWEHYEFIKYFDKLILSHEVNAVKPESKIYEAVENFTQKRPLEHLFIDDIKEYTEGAIARGWSGIQFLGSNDLITKLTELKIL